MCRFPHVYIYSENFVTLLFWNVQKLKAVTYITQIFLCSAELNVGLSCLLLENTITVNVEQFVLTLSNLTV